MDSNLHATQLCVSAGPPDPVENCSIINETRSRVHVECDAGHDGGMPQIFYAEVYLHPQHILQSNISAFNQPIFISSNLKPNTHYMFVIYAANSKDRSQTVAIIANTKAGVSNKSEYFVIKLFNYRYPVEKIGKCPTQYGKEDPSHVSTNKYIHKSIVKKMLGQEDGAPLVNGVLCLSTPKHNARGRVNPTECSASLLELQAMVGKSYFSHRSQELACLAGDPLHRDHPTLYSNSEEEKKKLKYRCVEISEDEIDLSSCEDYCEEIGGWGKCVEPYKFQPLKSVSEDRYTSVSNSPF
ncbi:hypothetical protein GQR58_002772 [Nymphon striatum]|nr:hypothetical protein GQR58_002772 [Nymphon striatum]